MIPYPLLRIFHEGFSQQRQLYRIHLCETSTNKQYRMEASLRSFDSFDSYIILSRLRGFFSRRDSHIQNRSTVRGGRKLERFHKIIRLKHPRH